MTLNHPSASITWPFRSSVTAFATISVASSFVAVTSLASLTMPPASSRFCSRSHGVIARRHSELFSTHTAKPGSSLKKCAPSAAEPLANATGLARVGSVWVVTPMDAPAERSPTPIFLPLGR